MKNIIHKLPIGISNIEIPTGYSDGISYLEQLGAINHKLNEVIDKVNNINIDRAEGEIVNKIVENTIVDIAQISPIGRYEQNYTTVGYAQGMCVININSEDVIVYATASNEAGKQSIGMIVGLLNGGNGTLTKVKEYSNLGHCNSVCSDGEYIYITCGGGKPIVSQIAKLNLNLELVNIYEYPEYINPYGIAYNNGKFYVLGSNRTLYITEDLHMLGNPKTLNRRNDVTFQGVVADNDYLYLNNGNWWTNYPSTSKGDYGQERCVNYIDVYTHQGEYIKSIVVNCPTELEEFDFDSNGNIIILSNSINSCVFLKSALYSSLTNFDTQNNLITVPQTFTDKSYNVYIGEAKGIRQDGTEQFPFNSFNMMYFGIPNNVTNLNINLTSDINQRLTPRGLVQGYGRLYIYGNNHTIKGGIRAYQENIYIKEVVFDGEGRTDTIAYFEKCPYVQIENCTIKRAANNTEGLRLSYCNTYLSNVKFDNSRESEESKFVNCFIWSGTAVISNSLTDDGKGIYNIGANLRYDVSNTSNLSNNLMQCVQGVSYSNTLNNVYNVGNMDLNNIISVFNTPINIAQCTNLPNETARTLYIIRTSANTIKQYVLCQNGDSYSRNGNVTTYSKIASWEEWQHTIPTE